MGTHGTDHALPQAIFSALDGADRRRRLRLLLTGVVHAQWVGLPAGVVALLVWRATGSAGALAAAFAVVAIAAALGAVRGSRRRDLAAAALELDRTCDLDAALSTAFEISRRAPTGDVGRAAVRQAERTASSIDVASVEAEPGGRSRFLVVPAAVFAAALLLPAAPESATGWFAPAGAVDGAGARGASRETDRTDAARAREGTPVARREDVVRALKDDADAARRAELAREPLKPPDEKRGERSRSRGARKAAGDRDADDEAGSGGSVSSRAGVTASGGAEAPVDVRERAIAREHFPEYGEVVRRYFGGPGG